MANNIDNIANIDNQLDMVRWKMMIIAVWVDEYDDIHQKDNDDEVNFLYEL